MDGAKARRAEKQLSFFYLVRLSLEFWLCDMFVIMWLAAYTTGMGHGYHYIWTYHKSAAATAIMWPGFSHLAQHITYNTKIVFAQPKANKHYKHAKTNCYVVSAILFTANPT